MVSISCFECDTHRKNITICQRGRGVPESGKASKPEEPARKPQTVREYHRAHEAEILPHVRRGLNLQDYSHFSLN
jgi:hypothetical protein